MDTNGFIVAILISILVSNTCNASVVFNIRKLISSESNNASTNPQASPIGSPVSPVNESNTKPINEVNSEKVNNTVSQISNQNNVRSSNDNNKTLPIDPKGPKKNDNHNETSGALSPPSGGKNGNQADHKEGKAVNASSPQLGNNGNCEGSLSICKDKDMIACIKTSNDGSEEMLLMVLNEGESTLKVNIKSPNSLENALAAFDVPKHDTHKVYISSTVVKNNELIVNSNNAKCVLPSVHPVSVEYFIHELSFYSKQVTPTYAAYAFFLLAIVFGGSWACCQLRKRGRQDGIPYQELEMGLPESSSAVNVDAAEGWDHDWDDDDDWDEDNAVKSPGGHRVRNISGDGLTARSSKKDGLDNDWDD
ncbi:hypothetical protein ACJIZ3_024534 [Penstemon smallii]|uniref:DUF7356 domain-containing protein n=1 Tax=Penstemon smallii TaxID=265156 RepID=A0ABD3TVA3_9LAMI